MFDDEDWAWSEEWKIAVHPKQRPKDLISSVAHEMVLLMN